MLSFRERYLKNLDSVSSNTAFPLAEDMVLAFDNTANIILEMSNAEIECSMFIELLKNVVNEDNLDFIFGVAVIRSKLVLNRYPFELCSNRQDLRDVWVMFWRRLSISDQSFIRKVIELRGYKSILGTDL